MQPTILRSRVRCHFLGATIPKTILALFTLRKKFCGPLFAIQTQQDCERPMLRMLGDLSARFLDIFVEDAQPQG
jgi:hypothetical protein